MKALYVYKIENSVKYTDKKGKWHVITRNRLQYSFKLRYGEVPVKLSHTYFADELPSIAEESCTKLKHVHNLDLIYINKRLFTKDKYNLTILGQNSDSSFHDVYIKLEDVSYITASIYPEVFDINKFTFDYIMKNLNAKEFIDFCKDNDLNCVTVVKEK